MPRLLIKADERRSCRGDSEIICRLAALIASRLCSSPPMDSHSRVPRCERFVLCPELRIRWCVSNFVCTTFPTRIVFDVERSRQSRTGTIARGDRFVPLSVM